MLCQFYTHLTAPDIGATGWQVVNLIQLPAPHNNGLQQIKLYKETENASFSESHHYTLDFTVYLLCFYSFVSFYVTLV